LSPPLPLSGFIFVKVHPFASAISASSSRLGLVADWRRERRVVMQNLCLRVYVEKQTKKT